MFKKIPTIKIKHSKTVKVSLILCFILVIARYNRSLF